ncbi:hypothetical protein HAX54_014783 [Datura stramonium]|uniref:Uncharacterized protein n=1 Tax=Datura stramonium TaxID=4076 RepID=A0ABS8Y7L8_DATST|nr:hypothetical protein [Datura stramonium]
MTSNDAGMGEEALMAEHPAERSLDIESDSECRVAYANAPGQCCCAPAIARGRGFYAFLIALGQGCLVHAIAPGEGCLTHALLLRRARCCAKDAASPLLA